MQEIIDFIRINLKQTTFKQNRLFYFFLLLFIFITLFHNPFKLMYKCSRVDHKDNLGDAGVNFSLHSSLKGTGLLVMGSTST